MKLRDKILYCRKKAGLSQEALAEQLGVSRQAVSKWETGEAVPEIGKLLLLARAFGVTTDWLLSEDEPENRSGVWTEMDSKSGSYEESVPPQAEDSYTYKNTENRRVPESWEHIPGKLGRMVRRYGWLYGLYVAFPGLLIFLMGFFQWRVMRSVLDEFNFSTFNGVSATGFSGGFLNIGGILMVIGGVIMLAGIVLALVLRRMGRK